MCLIRKEGYNFGIVKDKPIETYKVLFERDGNLISPCRGFQYQIGKIYEEMLGAISDCSMYGFPAYDKGFHMLTTIEGANQYLCKLKRFLYLQDVYVNQAIYTRQNFLVVVKCVIPNSDNTIYSYGVDSDYGIPGIVSNRIKIVGIVSKTPIQMEEIHLI